nr:M81 family metallopeptidase [Alkalispirochaeta americana]
MRVLVGGIHHESNTFNPIITGAEDFSLQRGDEIFGVLNDDDSISGIIKTLQTEGFQVEPILMARAVPNGVVSREFYLSVKEEFLQRARKARESSLIDGIALSLHGSMRVEGIGDAEGDLLEALREIFPHTPLSASLDMHATVTEPMVRCLDAVVGYKQAPHTDCFETGEHAARMLVAMLRQGVRPVIGWCKLPLIIAGEKTETSVEPMRGLIELLREREQQPGVMALSYLLGFPWADCPENGVSALVVMEESSVAARAEAEDLARAFWQERKNFRFHTDSYPPGEALEAALAAAREGAWPVYLSDSGDNPTAGSSADCTGFLGQILEYEPFSHLETPLLYAGIYDPPAVERCLQAGVGARLELALGARFDQVTSKPLRLEVEVLSLARKWERFHTDMVMVRAGFVELILVSNHIGFVTPRMFEALNRRVEDYAVIVVKLGYLTDPHKRCAARTIMALTPGSSNEVLETLPFTELSRPVFPLDAEIDHTPRGEAFGPSFPGGQDTL